MPRDGHSYVQSSDGRRRVTRARRRISLDFETFSEEQLVGAKSVGVWNYSTAFSTEVLMAAYHIDDDDLKHVDLTEDPLPAELEDALSSADFDKWAFNAAFERVITKNTLHIDTPYEGWKCTMALANMQSFTGDLFEIGKAMGLDTTKLKDKEGSRLIKLFCGPQRITKKNPLLRRDGMTDPEDWERFCSYNSQDVVAEEEIRDTLSRFYVPDEEWEMYEIDQRINDTGLPVNRQFVINADIMSTKRRAELHEEMREITGLDNPNSTQKFLPWLRERGYPYADLQKASVQKTLKLDAEMRKTAKTDAEAPKSLLTSDGRKALRLRRYASQTSIKKFPAILRRLSDDDMLRHAFQFGGAARTLRWAGRGPQPHNLTRTPKIFEAWDEKEFPGYGGDWEILEATASLIEAGNYDDLKMFMDEPMIGLSGSVRSSFQAHKGYKFTVCDLSAIESAVLAWVSNCVRMLNVFQEGRDPYKDFGTELYHKAYDAITKGERTICKPAVLGCGYQLGGGGMRNDKRTGLWGYAENMGVDITQQEAAEHVAVFRKLYREIPKFWADVDTAFRSAILGNSTTVNGLLKFERKGPYVTIELPGGRKMYYFKPKIVVKEFEGKDGGTFTRRVVSYMGKSQVTHQWGRTTSSGGKITENIVQAIARDILAMGLRRAFKAGFNIVGSVHDEIITMQRKGENYLTLQKLKECMIDAIQWATGLPLNAAGYDAMIYRKD